MQPEGTKPESLMEVYVKRPQAKRVQDISSKIVVKTGVNSSNMNESIDRGASTKNLTANPETSPPRRGAQVSGKPYIQKSSKMII